MASFIHNGGIERRYTTAPSALPKPVNRRAANGAMTIEGYGAVYYDGTPGSEYALATDYVERILPGAFDDAIRDDDVVGLYNHNADHILGRTSSGTMGLSTDSKGLRYEIDVNPDTAIGHEVAGHIRRGDLSGSSFAFRVLDENFRTEGGIDIREIVRVQLFDVGPVTFPAYEGTTTGTRGGYAPGADTDRPASRFTRRLAEVKRTIAANTRSGAGQRYTNKRRRVAQIKQILAQN